MRVLYVWFTAITVSFILILSWLVANTVMVSIASQALADVTGSALALVTLLEFIVAWWGPIFVVIVILWAIINSQETDPTGYM